LLTPVNKNTEFNVKCPYKVNQAHIFWGQWKGDEELKILYNNLGLTSKASEEIVSESTENYRF